MSSTETMRSWPRLVTRLEELPEPFRPRAEALAARAAFEHAVFLPPLVTPSSPQVEHLLVLAGGALFVLRRSRRELSESSIDLSKVTAVERGKILLYSWLSIDAGALEQTVAYNTVGEELLVPFLRAARAGAAGDARAHPGDARLEALIGPGYKFMNYGRMALEACDRIEALLFEPALPVNTLALFGRRATLRHATPHLWMLTQRELVIVRDEREFGLSNRPRYGAVTLWVPRDALRSAAYERRGPLVRLSVTTTGGRAAAAWFAADNSDLPPFADAIGANEVVRSAS